MSVLRVRDIRLSQSIDEVLVADPRGGLSACNEIVANVSRIVEGLLLRSVITVNVCRAVCVNVDCRGHAYAQATASFALVVFALLKRNHPRTMVREHPRVYPCADTRFSGEFLAVVYCANYYAQIAGGEISRFLTTRVLKLLAPSMAARTFVFHEDTRDATLPQIDQLAVHGEF